MSQSSLPKHKLRRVGTVKAVDAISSTDTILQRYRTTPWYFEPAISITINIECKIGRTKGLTVLHSEGSVNKAQIPNEKSLSSEWIPRQHLQGNL